MRETAKRQRERDRKIERGGRGKEETHREERLRETAKTQRDMKRERGGREKKERDMYRVKKNRDSGKLESKE